jgi:hypothetical protein
MDRKRLEKLRLELASLRRSQPKAKDLGALAGRLGRRLENRAKHPIYVSDSFPHLRPLPIPNHKGRDLPNGTKNSILNQPEDDLHAWNEYLSQEERENDDGSSNGTG